MPRFLLTDRPELWRRMEDSALRREEVELVLARDRAELTRRARAERFDAVLVEAGSDEALELRRALGGSPVAVEADLRLVEWGADLDDRDIARRLGLECRLDPRCGRRLLVQAENFSAITKDLSRTGVFLIGVPHPLPVGARFVASVRSRGAGPAARVEIRIVRHVASAALSHRLHGLGARIEALCPEDATLLKSWVGGDQ